MTISRLMLIVACSVTVVISSIAPALPAMAQGDIVDAAVAAGTDSAGAGMPVVPIADPVAARQQLRQAIKDFQKKMFTQAIVTMLINLLSFAANRLAYETATMIVNGGPAEDPLYDGTPAERFFRSYGEAVAGEALGLFNEALNESIENQQYLQGYLDTTVEDACIVDPQSAECINGKTYHSATGTPAKTAGMTAAIEIPQVLKGFNVCAPNARVGAAISLGIQQTVRPITPKCDFKTTVNNWDAFIASFAIDEKATPAQKTRKVLDNLGLSIRPGNNDLSLSVNLMSQTLSQMVQQSQVQIAKNLSNSGFKDVKDFITGQVETPADILRQKTKDDLATATGQQMENAKGVLSNNDALAAVGTQMASTFVNTLLSGLTQKLFSGLFNSKAPSDPFANIDAISLAGRDNAKDDFRFLLTATPLQITNYSLVNDFITCTPQARGLYNCVIDSNFATILARASAGKPMTVREAVDEGLLKGDWSLIPPTDIIRNQDPYCYTYAFCSTNLVKLRKARVIPVGWEMAAASAANNKDQPVKLKEVMDNFYNCNSNGELDAEHPYCKLIDPNWVLKYPETQCRMQVNGQLLETAGVETRGQECVDAPSCVKQNPDGTCAGYGYCTQEENVWRFRGQACEEQFASCVTYTSSDNKRVSYLKNTVDQAGCNEGNAGCTQYLTKRTLGTDGAFVWTTGNVPTTSTASDAYDNRIYFTGAVAKCDAAGGGCSELIRRTDSVRLNMLRNSGFETDENRDGSPDGWTISGGAWDNSGASAMVGKGGLKNGSATQEGIVLGQRRYYTLSYFGRGTDTSLRFSLYAGNTSAQVDLRGVSVTGDCSLDPANSGTIIVRPSVGETSYKRVVCTFTSPALSSPAIIPYGLVTAIVGNGNIDNIQLEQASNASQYRDGYGDSNVATLVAKVAPKYLGCTGAATDNPECKKYSTVCSENDVGCRRYRPQNGDPTVTGVATAQDICPAMCVGYDAYKEEATRYEPARFPVAFIPSTAKQCSADEVGCEEFTNLATEGKEYYTYLRSCSLENLPSGIENPNARTYYTWEGSDESGYQLRTWKLLKSDYAGSSYTATVSRYVDGFVGDAPCSNIITTESGVQCADNVNNSATGRPSFDTASCDERADIFTNPDCREFYDERGNIHYRLWSSTVSIDDACVAYRKTVVPGASTDAAQSAQYCAAASGYYNGANGACTFYGLAKESEGCSANAAGCREYTGGRSRNSRIVFQELYEDGSVNKWDSANGRLVYSNESLANGGHSLYATSSFRTYMADNGAFCTNPDGCAGAAGNFGGTCTVKGPVGTAQGERYCGTLDDASALRANKTYSLSFYAKGSGTLTAGFNFAGQGTSSTPSIGAAFGSGLTLTNEWKRYDLGPIDMNATTYPAFGDGTTLAFVLSSGGQMYLDNVVLREGEDSLTLVRNSWNTPAACDTDPTGAPATGYYLGCRAYTEEGGGTVNLKSFSRLCGEDKVGCDAYYKTQESTDPYASVYGARCTSLNGPVSSATQCHLTFGNATTPYLCTISAGNTTCEFDMKEYVPPEVLRDKYPHISYVQSTRISPADEDVFLIVTPQTTCDSSTAGCTEYGKPTYSQDNQTITSAASVYLINDPDTYAETLCSASELFCAAFTALDGTKSYFKNPQNQTCEYRTDVVKNGSTYTGWFKAGTDDFCYQGAVEGGVKPKIWKNGDAGYAGWVGVCPESANLCTEFQDPLDAGDNKLYNGVRATSHFFVNDSSVRAKNIPGEASCGDNQVSLKEGCVLFRDPAVAALKWNASASDMLSRHADTLSQERKAPFSLVGAVDCSRPASETTFNGVDLCARRCVYSATGGTVTMGSASNMVGGVAVVSGAAEFGSSCVVDSDCAPVVQPNGEARRAKCAENVRTSTVSVANAVPRLGNDSNLVLKVTRDRQCSEWLACASEERVWDSRAGAYRSVCNAVGLCNEFSTSAAAGFCNNWVERPASALTAENYADRDTSWHGPEYSGYSIPNQLPAEKLSQVLVGSGTCDWNNINVPLRTTVTFGGQNAQSVPAGQTQGDACKADADCGLVNGAEVKGACRTDQPDQYRLAYDAGTCSTDGAACSTGVCTLSGSACTTNNDCGGGAGDVCKVGQCVVRGNSCTKDREATDCNVAGGETCDAGFCVRVTKDVVTIADYATANNSCGGGVFRPSTLNNGTCRDNRCLLTLDARPFDVNNVEGKSCRAFPEETSPFPNSVVTKWVDAITGAVLDAGAVPNKNSLPYTYRDGFDQVAICQPGEDCSCSYTRRRYGIGGAVSKYFGIGSAALNDASRRGICSLGKVGAACAADVDCFVKGDTVKSKACLFPSRQDDVYGVDGYCLERDLGVNVNGDPAQKACLTWLPIDRPLGSTDLNAKNIQAGLVTTDLNYCSRIDAYIKPTAFSACSLRYEPTGDQNISPQDSCFQLFDDENPAALACPPGYYGVMGMYAKTNKDTPGHANRDGLWLEDYADDAGIAVDQMQAKLCANATEPVEGADRSNACPFMCIPYNSMVVDNSGSGVAGQMCNPGDVDLLGRPDYVFDRLKYVRAPGGDNNPTLYQMPFYWVPNPVVYEGLYARLKDCQAPAVRVDSYSSAIGNESLIMYPDSDSNPGVELRDNENGVALGGSVMPAQFSVTTTRDNLGIDVVGWINGQYSKDVPSKDAYFACSEVTTVQDSELNGAVRTDVLYQATSKLVLDQGFPSSFGDYAYLAIEPSNKFFGAALSDLALSMKSEPEPPVLAQCLIPTQGLPGENTTRSAVQPLRNGSAWICPVQQNGTQAVQVENLNDAQARAYQALNTRQLVYVAQGAGVNDGTLGLRVTGYVADERWRYPSGSRPEAMISQFVARGIGYRVYQDGVWQRGLISGGDLSGLSRFTLPSLTTAGGSLLFSEDTENPYIRGVRGSYGVAQNGSVVRDDGLSRALTTQAMGSINDWDTRVTEKNPPKIWAVNTRRCEGTMCEEGASGKFTVNDQDAGEARGINYFAATVKFFAAADKNHLPLRRIVVEWGDKKTNADQVGSKLDDNYYKNHRGLVPNEKRSWCDLGSEWGLTPESCDPNYISYSKVYTCPVNAPLDPCTGADGNYDQFKLGQGCKRVVDGVQQCVFKPRVHVRDNWGWCTGSCSLGGGAQASEGQCFDPNPSISSLSINPAQPGAVQNECYIDGNVGNSDPWIYYDGMIVVTRAD